MTDKAVSPLSAEERWAAAWSDIRDLDHWRTAEEFRLLAEEAGLTLRATLDAERASAEVLYVERLLDVWTLWAPNPTVHESAYDAALRTRDTIIRSLRESLTPDPNPETTPADETPRGGATE